MKPRLLDRFITILLGVNLIITFWSLAVNFSFHHLLAVHIT
jgi:hypothetical protein